MQLLLRLALALGCALITPSSARFLDPSTRRTLPLAFTPSHSFSRSPLHRRHQHGRNIPNAHLWTLQSAANTLGSKRQLTTLILAAKNRELLEEGEDKAVATDTTLQTSYDVALASSSSAKEAGSRHGGKLLPLAAVPRHVAIIPDGNGRWAQARGLPRTAGHAAGVKRVIEAVNVCKDAGVERLSLFAFSTENWERKPREVATILTLVENQLRDLRDSFKDQNIKVVVFGQRSRLPQSLRTLLHDIDKENAETESSFYYRRSVEIATALSAPSSSSTADEHESRGHPWEFTLALALSYGGRSACATAAQHLALHVQQGNLSPNDIDEKTFAAALGATDDDDYDDRFDFGGGGGEGRRGRADIAAEAAAASSSVDLCVRTGGERRLSNFLLYEMAYAELDFVDEAWPEFSPGHLRESLQRFAERQRRFGKETTSSASE